MDEYSKHNNEPLVIIECRPNVLATVRNKIKNEVFDKQFDGNASHQRKFCLSKLFVRKMPIHGAILSALQKNRQIFKYSSSYRPFFCKIYYNISTSSLFVARNRIQIVHNFIQWFEIRWHILQKNGPWMLILSFDELAELKL